MAVCAPFNPAGPYVTGLLDYIDCQSLALAQQGYQALGAGSGFAATLNGLLVIAVAVAGYRMLMGGPFLLRDAVYLLLRIGFVLALALQWSAYQPLVYDVATRAPQELLGTILPQGGAPTGGNTPVIARVQGVDAGMAAVLSADEAAAAAGTSTGQPGAPAPNLNIQTRFGQIPELAPATRETLVSAESLLVTSVVAAFAVLKIITAVMLALGPLFIASALFEATRGLFVGWLRVLLGTVIAAIALPAVVTIELAVLEPQVTALQRLFETGAALGPLPDRVWTTIALFAVVMLAAMLAALWAASALRLPDGLRSEFVWLRELRDVVTADQSPLALAAPSATVTERTHTQRVADAVLASERREADAEPQTQVVRIAAPRDEASPLRSEPLVQASAGIVSRDVVRRRSAAAGRRDMI